MRHVYIYHSEHKQGTYLYLPEKDNFNEVPDTLLDLLGNLRFSFEFTLDERKKLVRGNATEILQNIKTEGYFLQLPPSRFENANTIK